MTYKDAGVDIERADEFVEKLKDLVRTTHRKGVIGGIGHFGALFEVPSGYKRPVLVSSTDGVGTKLKVAFMAGVHDTVGVDLVAMSVNDILTLGAEPLFFLDYFATGKLSNEVALEVMKGIVQGCKEANCALIGGETAEMPGFYQPGEYDLSGFAVGVVERDEIIDGTAVRAGDVVIGLSSSGLHSNGYSLARKVFFELHDYGVDSYIEELGTKLALELLKPTRIYVRAYIALKEAGIRPKAMAHITGGGIPGNLSRVLPDGLEAVIVNGSWPELPIFGLIRKLGNIAEEEMRKTFNLGIGYTIVVSEKEGERVIDILNKTGYPAYRIGYIQKGRGGVRYEEGN
ncbi:MAG: phosphoribosylformylglycinamidine cyclo-ligase [Nitrospirae bacterium]|nr:MAG: phosphoribosylformylglycinamidine cyclo-ligase [Nitrospirota bacterium]